MKDNIFLVLQCILLIGGPLFAKYGITVQQSDLEGAAGALATLVGIVWKFWHWNKTPDAPPAAPTSGTGIVNTLTLLAVIFFFSVCMWGCNTTQQRTTANTIGAVEAAADGGVAGYYDAVLKGFLPTNDVPKVSKAYNSLHASILLSIDLAQNNTNALASTNLTTELGDFLRLLTTVFPTNNLEKITPTP